MDLMLFQAEIIPTFFKVWHYYSDKSKLFLANNRSANFFFAWAKFTKLEVQCSSATKTEPNPLSLLEGLEDTLILQNCGSG